MTNLKDHYDKMWENAFPFYQQGQFYFDPSLDSSDDDRLGITLLFRPNEAVKKKIEAFLNDIHTIAPHQYYYPASDIHMTVMSVISCYAGFSLDQVNIPGYSELIAQCLANITSFSIHFKGITASQAGIMIQGFPENEQLNRIRNNLRDAFKHSKLEHSLDQRYRITTAHLTILRFRQPIDQVALLIEKLLHYRAVDFGSCQVRTLELVFNDWYQRKEKVKSLKTFSLQDMSA